MMALIILQSPDTIIAGVVAVPTLSVWTLCILVVGLGALALRRLRGPPPMPG